MMVRSMPRPCAHATRSPSSSSFTPLQRDRVDLHREAGGLRGVDPGQHLVELAPARDRAELVRVERVERDVDALHAAVGELGGVFRQLRAVGGQRQLVEPVAEMARERAHQGHDAAPHQRLAAGEAQLAHAARDERAAQPVEFLEREQVLLRQERHVLRHAVDAAEIAAVGHRDAQIGDRAPERIDQRRRLDGGGAFEAHMSRRCGSRRLGAAPEPPVPSALRQTIQYDIGRLWKD